MRRQRGEKVPEQYESSILRKDGTTLAVEYHVGVVEFEGETGSLAIIRDISERINYEHRLEQLSDYTNCLNSVDSIESLYQITYEIIDLALGFKVLDIITVKEGYIEDVKRSGENKEVFRASLDGPGITVRAVNAGKTQLINDIRNDPNYLSGVRANQTLSELAVPVFVNNKVFLVLNVESERVNAFNDQDKRLLEIFSTSMGSAIERLIHLETILHQKHELESEKHRTRYMIENAPYVTVILDPYGKVKYVNKMFTSVLGFGKEEIIGKRYSKLPTLQTKDSIRVMKILLSLRRGIIPKPFSMKFLTKSGQNIEMNIFVMLYNTILKEREIIVMARVIDEENLIYNTILNNSKNSHNI
jgi:PAS domain S-box-containing protein